MISLKNINKSFKKTDVLKGISLEVAEGECVVLSGVSGSGKSTLLAIIASLMKASSGEIEVNNTNINKLNDIRLSDFRLNVIGFVPQTFHLFEMLNVRENILPSLLLLDLDAQELEKRVIESMQLAQIEHKSASVVSTLSGGEKQRCIIARALINNPKVLLFDEPTANLDKENTLKFIELLHTLKGKGKTILIATHDPLISELEFIDKIISIKDGSIE